MNSNQINVLNINIFYYYFTRFQVQRDLKYYFGVNFACRRVIRLNYTTRMPTQITK